MRYAYGVTSALLLGGAALSLATGFPAGAQVAQNDESRMQAVVPRAGAPASFADLTAQLQPAVVNIAVRQKVQVENPLANTPLGAMMGQGAQARVAEAVGSGFIVSADGYVVTNNHVISLDRKGAADNVTVKLADGAEYPARIVGRDVDSDIAVLKIDAKSPLPFVRFGESSKARAGDWIIAIGNPFGLGGSVTSGIVSSVNRNTGSGAYDHYIQTDASINSGNSGGPMFDMRGNVIGINNWIVAPSGGNIGIGFAIPSDTAKPIVEKLMAGKAIERGFLGVQIQPVTDAMADSLGLPHNRGELVRGVPAGMPGAQAGIKPGDIVIKVNGIEVTPDTSLSTIVANIAPGTRIPIDLLRQGKPLTVTATVARRPGQDELAKTLAPPEQRESPFNNANGKGEGPTSDTLGLRVLDMDADIAQQLRVPGSTRGAVIARVDSDSDAANQGLQRGDIVVGVNFQPITSVSALDAAIKAAKAAGRPSVTIEVMRPGLQGTIYIGVRLK
ncbi:Do family serine endopeptidase [Novosphingobium sp.]|uniref:Do family serine endopeptidase n=1 Tax=Novosphingobium sp. TaxID=1874826 RepID=UPI0025E72BFC|nr:Do family serine endopeptidase [Novosphingobium sp.]MCC6926528.1 Do family serine endopeptidase [Novosphingobium sp.]